MADLACERDIGFLPAPVLLDCAFAGVFIAFLSVCTHAVASSVRDEIALPSRCPSSAYSFS
jgi:hypothetical protein